MRAISEDWGSQVNCPNLTWKRDFKGGSWYAHIKENSRLLKTHFECLIAGLIDKGLIDKTLFFNLHDLPNTRRETTTQ